MLSGEGVGAQSVDLRQNATTPILPYSSHLYGCVSRCKIGMRAQVLKHQSYKVGILAPNTVTRREMMGGGGGGKLDDPTRRMRLMF